MKIAVLISGYLRGIKETINNLKLNIIQDNDCDIYLHYTQDKSDIKYCNEQTDIYFIIKELNLKLILYSNNLILDKNIRKNNILNQNYKFSWLNDERIRISKLENIKYDVIIKIRPDIYLDTKLNYDLDKNFITIPLDSKIDKKKLHNSTDNYICDILAYGSEEIMNKYFDFYYCCNKLIDQHGLVNETLLYEYLNLNLNNIKYKLIDIQYIVILSTCNVIAITGDSGSGKTTLSNIVNKLYSSSFLLECDRYHKWERSNDNWEKYTHLNTEANYIIKMKEDVFNLKYGKHIYQVDYNHITGKFINNEYIESKDNLIVCGLHSLYIPSDILNIKIYMDTDDNLRIPWKIKRDIIKRGYTKEKVYEQILKRLDDFEKFVKPQIDVADIIINMYTDYVFDINLYDINDIINIFIRIGIRKNYKKSYNITYMTNINKIVEEETHIFLYLNNSDDYENTIINIIKNM